MKTLGYVNRSYGDKEEILKILFVPHTYFLQEKEPSSI